MNKIINKIRVLFARNNKKYIQINKDKCQNCGECNKVCPMHLKIYDGIENDPNADCIRCEMCVNVCKYGVLFVNKKF